MRVCVRVCVYVSAYPTIMCDSLGVVDALVSVWCSVHCSMCLCVLVFFCLCVLFLCLCVCVSATDAEESL